MELISISSSLVLVQAFMMIKIDPRIIPTRLEFGAHLRMQFWANG